jgi:hypothetical protein
MFLVAYVIKHVPCTCWLLACSVSSLNCDWRQDYAENLQFAFSQKLHLEVLECLST